MNRFSSAWSLLVGGLLAVGLLGVGPVAPVQAQTGTITGRVTDADTGQPLPGANVQLVGAEQGVATDALGRFVLRNVPAGEVAVRASFVGFESSERTATVNANASVTVHLALSPDVSQLSEVVVQSEKITRDLQETITSVNVVQAQQVEALSLRDWREASRLVGNFLPSGFGGFIIRGITSTGVGSGGTGTTAQLYVDGVAQNTTTTRTGIRGLWDVEAVEVLRGPQSTHAGRNALAGAVSIQTKDPVFRYDAAGRVTVGNQGTQEGALMVNAPLIDNQLALRVSGEYLTQDPGFEYTRLDDLNFDGFEESLESEYADVRARLLFTPEALPGLAARLSYTYAYDRPNLNQDATGPDFFERQSDQVVAPREWNNVHNTSLTLSYDLTSALTLTSISGLLLSDRYFDTLAYQDPDAVAPVGNRQNRTSTDFTQEVRLNVETDRTTAVLGGYVGTFNTDTDRTDRGDIFNVVEGLIEQAVGGPVPRFEILYKADVPSEVHTTNLAAFGEVNHEVLADRLTLTAGLRYDRETFEQQSSTEAEVSAPNSPLPDPVTAAVLNAIRARIMEAPTSPEATYDVLLPKVGATVDVTDDMSIGATVQRGYRAGGAQVLSTGDRNEFDPEFTWNYELAYRSRWLNQRLHVNANAFYTDWQDQQLLDRIEGTTLFRTVNAGSSTLYGAEVEVRARPVRFLTAFASLGLVETEFDEFTTQGRDLGGFAFPNAPGETFSIGASYTPPTGVFGSASASYTGSYYSDIDLLPDAEEEARLRGGDYWLVDARVGYATRLQGTRASIALFARNAFDEDVVLQRNVDPVGDLVARLGTPRVVGVTLEVSL